MAEKKDNQWEKNVIEKIATDPDIANGAIKCTITIIIRKFQFSNAFILLSNLFKDLNIKLKILL